MPHEKRTVVVFSGGGTGGHLYPALAIAEALVEQRSDVRAFFVGSAYGIEARVLPERGVEHLLVPVRGARRSVTPENVGVVADLFGSVLRVGELFQRIRPALTIVTGGYAGAPAGLVAAAGGVPLALQEQNALPGLTTRLLARFARQVHVAFPEAVGVLPARARSRARLSGNPIRSRGKSSRADARASLRLRMDGSVVLVVGGSQGSQALNGMMLGAVRGVVLENATRPPGLQVLWATGPAHFLEVSAAVAELGPPDWLRLVAYLHRMEDALTASDVAIGRAGAMTTSEFLAWGLPAILVPLPTAAGDHQTRNAQALEATGAAVHLPESGLDGDRLWDELVRLVSDPARLEAYRRAARGRGRPDAARDIAVAVRELLPATSSRARPANTRGSTP